MIAPHRLVMPGIVSIYWLLRAGREHRTQTHTHTDTRARLIKENKNSKYIFFLSLSLWTLPLSHSQLFTRCHKHNLEASEEKKHFNNYGYQACRQHTHTPLRQRVIFFFFCFLFFCRARDSVLPLRSCINYLSPCAADTLFLTNA